jgi:hypothetical protein
MIEPLALNKNKVHQSFSTKQRRTCSLSRKIVCSSWSSDKICPKRFLVIVSLFSSEKKTLQKNFKNQQNNERKGNKKKSNFNLTSIIQKYY